VDETVHEIVNAVNEIGARRRCWPR